MSNDIKEVKVDVRSFSRDLQDVRTIAVSAEAEAKRANTRIDHLIENGKGE
jgi:outer membrane murein-binding lipoprotein Lpp